MFLMVTETLEDGERALIGRLYTEYARRVKKMAISILHSDRYAEDVVSETFLKIIRYREKFIDVSEEERIRLIIIFTRSVCFNIHKHNKKFRIESLESFGGDEDDEGSRLDIPSDDDILKVLVDTEAGNLLKNAVNSLGDPARDMIILKFYYGMKNTQIAEFYKTNPSTVATVIGRSDKRLKTKLGRYFDVTNK